MLSPDQFVETHRPAGGRRSGKRDFIVHVFLRQSGHLSADELVSIIRSEDARISRATIYRKVGGNMQKSTVDLDFPIFPGDTIVISERWL